MVIGVLALQGDFEKHQQALRKLGVDSLQVKSAETLKKCAGLIIPGGESTTLLKLINKIGIFDELIRYGQNNAIMGTCAGLILLSQTITNHNLQTLGLINIKVTRNAYGRQIDSFIDDISLILNGQKRNFSGVFIRAPKIEQIGEEVKILAYRNEEVAMVENKTILAATFHPELTDDLVIHDYFAKKTVSLMT